MEGFPQGFVPLQSAPIRPQRGALLTVLLGLVTLGALFGLGASLTTFAAVKQLARTDSQSLALAAPVLKTLLFTALLSAAQLACSFGLWSWKKWGAYGYGAVAVLICMASAKGDPQHHVSLGSLVWLILMVAAVLPKWGYFED